MGCDSSRDYAGTDLDDKPIRQSPTADRESAPTAAPAPAEFAVPAPQFAPVQVEEVHGRPLFDNFFVIGYLPNSFSAALQHDDDSSAAQAPGGDKPAVVYQYPEASLLGQTDILSDFCFPTTGSAGDARTYILPAMMNEMQKSCFGTPYAQDEAASKFVFLLNRTSGTAEQEDLFGIVVASREPLLWQGSCVMTTPRAYCILSKWPLFELHFDWLHSIAEQASKIQFKALFEAQSSGAMQSSSDWHSVDVGAQIGKMESLLLQSEREAAAALRRNIPGTDELALQQVVVENIIDWGCAELFQCVHQSNLQCILSCLLLEEPVVLVASTAARLSSCSLALSVLLLPLRISGVHFPVLPLPRLADIIDAPVPYLVGVVESAIPKRGFPADAVVVHLDTRGHSSSFRFLKNGFAKSFSRQAEWPANNQSQGTCSGKLTRNRATTLENSRRIVGVIRAEVEKMIAIAQIDGAGDEFIQSFRQTQMFTYYMEQL